MSAALFLLCLSVVWIGVTSEFLRPSHCYLAAEVGQCKAAITKYYFDSSTKTCFNFTYGGCGGNGNNFESVEECMTNCTRGTKLPLDPTGSVVDICQETVDVGPCRAMIPKFYFDGPKKQCLQFNYGGCGGNNNRFESQDDCESRCLRVIKKQAESNLSQGKLAGRCFLLPETGTCRALLSRYYYDRSSNTCHNFKYGGCGGNENNFETRSECETVCLFKQTRSDDMGGENAGVPLKVWSAMILMSISLQSLVCNFR